MLNFLKTLRSCFTFIFTFVELSIIMNLNSLFLILKWSPEHIQLANCFNSLFAEVMYLAKHHESKDENFYPKFILYILSEQETLHVLDMLVQLSFFHNTVATNGKIHKNIHYKATGE